ncbi:MAG: DUF3362 domain-containing protein, partial [Oscillospiraceae bacterium]
DNRIKPEQVQDFYPTPGTVATCMYYTGLDPFTMKEVYVARTPEEKATQRALLQYFTPKNGEKIKRALAACGRQDLARKLLPGVQLPQGAKAPQKQAVQNKGGRPPKGRAAGVPPRGKKATYKR